MTVQKRLILERIRETPSHLTAEEIYQDVRAVIPQIALGTVYRNLGVLASEGKIGVLSVPNKPDRYERHASPHDHMICNICGGVRDFLIPGLPDAIGYQIGEKVLSYHLTVQYICPECREKLS